MNYFDPDGRCRTLDDFRKVKGQLEDLRQSWRDSNTPPDDPTGLGYDKITPYDRAIDAINDVIDQTQRAAALCNFFLELGGDPDRVDPEKVDFSNPNWRKMLGNQGALETAATQIAIIAATEGLGSVSALRGVAAETKTVTLYRGTTYYDALEAVGDNAVNMERVVSRQVLAGYSAERQGLYLTTQESTAQFYADLAGLQGRGGGPAVLRFEVPEAEFHQFLRRHSIQFEAPVPRPPVPEQTETLIPTSAVDELNTLSTIVYH